MSEETSTPLDKQAMREALAGYVTAAEVIEQERIERLRRMTPEESLRDYAALVVFHWRWLQALSEIEQEGLRRLEQRRLEEKLAVRRAFEKVALAEGKL